MDIAKYENDR